MGERPNIIVFDSGSGGLSVLDCLMEKGLAADYTYLADTGFWPYGTKSDDALRQRVPQVFSAAKSKFNPQLFVMACNTASTIAIEETRAVVETLIVGAAPAIKPAASLTQTGVIGFLATPGTVARDYCKRLIADFASHCTVLSCGSSLLVELAERKMAGETLPPEEVARTLAPLFEMPDAERMDVGVLACTHFPLLREEIKAASPPGLTWIDTGEALARRAGELLGMAPANGGGRCVAAYVTGEANRGMGRALAARGFPEAQRFGVD